MGGTHLVSLAAAAGFDVAVAGVRPPRGGPNTCDGIPEDHTPNCPTRGAGAPSGARIRSRPSAARPTRGRATRAAHVRARPSVAAVSRVAGGPR